MKKNSFVFKLVLIAFFVNLSLPLFSQSNSFQHSFEEEDTTTEVARDLRRFEIITLGAMPFVMLDSTLVYSGVKWIKNDFSSEFAPGFNQKFTQKEQTGLILTSLGICIGIGITDLIINIVTRNKKKSNKNINNSISIMPIYQDPDATKIDFDENSTKE